MNEDQSWPNELQKQVDDAHHTTDHADTPPPGLWHHIRAQVQPQPIVETKESQPMFTTATLPQSISAPIRSTPQGQAGGFRHYASLVATMALVLAIAAGGWLAMSQMPGGDGNGRFAAVQGTPAVAQTCDVEPLTVDEVMEIVRNPYRYMYERADADTRDEDVDAIMAELDLAEAAPMPNRWEVESVNRVTPSEEEFEQASAAVSRYADCAEGINYGQYWALIHPSWVQTTILSSFQVFADEDTVRTKVEETIGLPVDSNGYSLDAYYTVYGDVTIVANPDIEMADRILWSTPYDEPIVAMGLRVTDEEGEVIIETGSTGYPHEIQSGSLTLRPVVVVQKSSYTGEWYVLPWLGSYS